MAWRVFLIAGFLIAFSSQVFGQVTVSLSPSSTTVSAAGGTVTFTASIEGDAGDLLSGYDIFVDIVGLDLDNSGPISIANQNFATVFDVTDATQPGDPRDFGFSGTNFAAPGVAINSKVDLFSFDVNFAPVIEGQTFQFDLDPTAIGAALNINGASIDLTTVAFENAVVTAGSPFILGDCDLNGVVNFLDISPFIAILAAGPFLDQADCNRDGVISFLDISAFIEILAAQ